MKQRITIEDLDHLNPNQQQNLRELWLPKRYDLALARVCVNAETEEYVDVEFSIGGIHVRPNGTMKIYDLRAVDGFRRYSQDDEGEGTYEEPVSFRKEECLPLLNIGDMIEIMDKMKFRNFHFYILAGTGVEGCEVGNFNSLLKSTILNDGYRKSELCDVLWKMICAQL